MKVAVLFSGGKDSAFAAYLAREHGHELSCLITILSENPESYMFHTPSISKVKKQAEAADIPLIIQKTKFVLDRTAVLLIFSCKWFYQ